MICPFCKKEFKSTIRSNHQNRFYWGVCIELISEHTGYTPDELHDILKNKFLDKKVLKIKTKSGNEEFSIYKSTTELTTSEFKQYIEQIQHWAAEELNVVIPDPNENDRQTS